MTIRRNITIRQGQSLDLLLAAVGLDQTKPLRGHIRRTQWDPLVVQILDDHLAVETNGVSLVLGATVSSAWALPPDSSGATWVYDIEQYDPGDSDDVLRLFEGEAQVIGEVTRETDITPVPGLPSGDGRYVRFDGAQGLSTGEQAQARANIGVSGGGGAVDWGDIGGTLGDQTDLAAALALKADTASLGGAAALNVGTAAGTVAAGDDARLSDARTPTAHASTHATAGSDPIAAADIGAATAAQGALADTAVQPARQISAGTGLSGGGDLSADRTLTVVYGSTAGTACEGNDARLSDARTPTPHPHPLSDLEQSGATTGQVSAWTGSSWTPVTISITASQISDSTTSGRALLTAANVAAQITALGLATVATSGAYGDLSGLPTLGTAAAAATGDFEPAGAVSTHASATSGAHGISSFGASLIDDADAAAARTTLGLGGAATQSVGTTAGTVAAGNDDRFGPLVITLGNVSGSTEIDLQGRADAIVTATATGAVTWTVANWPAAGRFSLRLTNGGAHTQTYPTGHRFADGTAPELTASGRDTLIVETLDTGTTSDWLLAGADIQAPA